MSGPTTPKKSDLDGLTAFQWEVQPEAEKLVRKLLILIKKGFKDAELFEKRLRDETGTRLLDWVDYLELPYSKVLKEQLKRAGFKHSKLGNKILVWQHSKGMFPPVLLNKKHARYTLALKADSIADFCTQFRALSSDRAINRESPHAQIRTVHITEGGKNRTLLAVERHGYNGFEPHRNSSKEILKSLRHLEKFRARRRDFDADEKGFAHAEKLIKAAIKDIGRDWACDLFFRAEREYWQRRNRAGQIQKARQDALGLGWANHDHHTYRSSRHCFQHLIALLEMLGFKCRERFYAGHEAGWGAQVLEQPVTNICIFADVDMTPEEVKGDFAHKPFAEKKDLGTVGLWCALHGEAFLQAGMHHLECQFDFEELTKQLDPVGVKMMKPFTNFPYLRQAFTEGERWPVKEERLQKLLKAKKITDEQAEKFRKEGALGSHLENLERNQGFKGFNQTGISEIISATDPRKQK
jgi:hypothetical protein